MDTYWESFIEKYKDILPDYPLKTILHAFWIFCNPGKGEEEISDIFKEENEDTSRDFSRKSFFFKEFLDFYILFKSYDPFWTSCRKGFTLAILLSILILLIWIILT